MTKQVINFLKNFVTFAKINSLFQLRSPVMVFLKLKQSDELGVKRKRFETHKNLRRKRKNLDFRFSSAVKHIENLGSRSDVNYLVITCVIMKLDKNGVNLEPSMHKSTACSMLVTFCESFPIFFIPLPSKKVSKNCRT